MTERILESYQVRKCFVCGVIGPCPHREPKVEEAYQIAQYWHPLRKQPQAARPTVVKGYGKQGTS